MSWVHADGLHFARRLKRDAVLSTIACALTTPLGSRTHVMLVTISDYIRWLPACLFFSVRKVPEEDFLYREGGTMDCRRVCWSHVINLSPLT
jgi:hypothetical protein